MPSIANTRLPHIVAKPNLRRQLSGKFVIGQFRLLNKTDNRDYVTPSPVKLELTVSCRFSACHQRTVKRAL